MTRLDSQGMNEQLNRRQGRVPAVGSSDDRDRRCNQPTNQPTLVPRPTSNAPPIAQFVEEGGADREPAEWLDGRRISCSVFTTKEGDERMNGCSDVGTIQTNAGT